MITAKEYQKCLDEVLEEMTEPERYRYFQSLKNVKIPSAEEILDSIKFSLEHRKVISATLRRMDNIDWAKQFEFFNNTNRDVSLLEICDEDVGWCNAMLDLDQYYNFLD